MKYNMAYLQYANAAELTGLISARGTRRDVDEN
jgi:hypothetical protein